MYEDKEEMDEEEEFDKLAVDLDYEFDANCFFDFTRPESSFEAEVSETWFHSAPTYLPSLKHKWREETNPESSMTSLRSNASSTVESMTSYNKIQDCVKDSKEVKHKWREETNPESSMTSLRSNASSTVESMTSYNKIQDCVKDSKEGPKHHDNMVENSLRTKEKSLVKSLILTRSSTLMKPTASHLAKLKSASEIYSSRSVGRSPKSLNGFSDTSSRSPLSVYQDTKRQKLDIDYLLKVARLKHKDPMLHKLSKVPAVVANTPNFRAKPIIPREPYLETAHRAQRHRSRNNRETEINANLKPSSSKEQPVNRKILKTSPLSPQKSDRDPPALEKLKYPAKTKSSCNPPTELFKKLSMKSEVESNSAAPTRSKQLTKKVRKENVPGFFRREMSVS